MWGCGVVLFCMLNYRFPFHFQTCFFHFKSMRAMYREQTDYPDYIRSRFSEANSAPARDLVEKMVTPSEQDRPTMADVLQHQWFTVAAAAAVGEVLRSCSSGSGSGTAIPDTPPPPAE